jgi:N-acetylmuramoyl-L-alanine amidase
VEYCRKIGEEGIIGKMIKRFLTSGLFLLAILFAFPALGFAEKAVVIDPGHGGIFTGTCGYTHEIGKDLCERDVNLSVALKLQQALKFSGIKVYLTRSTDIDFASQRDEDLNKRVQIANGYAKGNNDNSVFISVHHNASPSTAAKGYETYYYDAVNHYDPAYPSDPMQKKYLPDDKRLAETIHPIVLKDLGLIDRKIHNDESFVVIRNAQMPSVLVELGYMTNQQEEARIKTADYQTKAAQALAKAIVSYFKVFEVYRDNTKLATFTVKQDALNYATKQSGFIQVFDKDNQTYIWDNANFLVYHKTGGIIKSFPTEQDAISFAQNQGEARVVSKSSGNTVWSNFLNKVYLVEDSSNTLIGSYYDVTEAINNASKTANRKVIKSGTNEVIWTNISGLAVTRNVASSKVFGLDRYATSIKVSNQLYPTGFPADKPDKVVILATGQNPADALSAATLSPKYGNAPLLLNPSVDGLQLEVKNEILRLGAKKVVIVGGTGVIGSSIETGLHALNIETERLYGKDRYETNQKILEKLGNVNGVLLASGESYADALAAAPIAAANNWAIVLTQKNSISSSALAYMKDKQVAILGGDGVVYETIADKIRSQNGTDKVVRLGGIDRYETLASILWYFKDNIKSNTVLVATGTNFPDAMAAAPLSIDTKAPLILVDSELNKSVESFLMKYSEENKVTNVLRIGGVVSDSVNGTIINKLK